MRPVLVVVFGNKGAGKDTFSDALAAALRRNHGVASKRTAFAEPLKLAALHLIGIPLEVSNGPQERKESTMFYGRSARSWLQWLGTEVGRRGVAEDLWANRACDLAAEALEPAVIVSDGRFRNELTVPRVRFAGDGRRAYAILVRRPSLASPAANAHPSEREVYDMACEHEDGGVLFDAVIYNDRDLESLRDKAALIAEELVC